MAVPRIQGRAPAHGVDERSRVGLVHPELRRFLAPSRDHQVKTVSTRVEKAGSGHPGCRDLFEEFIVVGIRLPDHREIPFAARGIQAMSLGIEEHIIRIRRNRHMGGLSAGVAIEL